MESREVFMSVFDCEEHAMADTDRHASVSRQTKLIVRTDGVHWERSDFMRTRNEGMTNMDG
jgi:hypothetical protein